MVVNISKYQFEAKKSFGYSTLFPVVVLQGAIRRATIALKFQPMLCGSAYKNKGVQLLLDAACRYLPAPSERKNLAYDQDDNEAEKTLQCVHNKPFVGTSFFQNIFDGRAV